MLARAFHCWWSWMNIFSFFRRPVLPGPHGENSGDFRGKTESSPIGSLAQVSPRHRSRRAQEPTQASVRRGSGIAQVSLAWLYSMHHIGYNSVVWNDALVSTLRSCFDSSLVFPTGGLDSVICHPCFTPRVSCRIGRQAARGGQRANAVPQ